MLADLDGFLGAVVVALIILTTGYIRADAIASLLVVGWTFRAASRLLCDSVRILLEAAFEGIDIGQIRARTWWNPTTSTNSTDLHVWTVTSHLHVRVVIDDSCFPDGHAPQLLDELQQCLVGHIDVEHSTSSWNRSATASANRAPLYPQPCSTPSRRRRRCFSTRGRGSDC